MEITYANGKVEKYFKDYKKMQKKLPFEWVKTIKKHMDRLKAAECFGDFLKLRLGKPEQLEGCESIRYSLHVAANVRLIIEPSFSGRTGSCKDEGGGRIFDRHTFFCGVYG